MALTDFLGNLGTVLGPAAAGYTRGLAQGEQAKINLLRQREQDQLRNEQLNLQRFKLKQDAEKALAEGRDRIREMYMKAGIEASAFLRDQQNRADLSAQGVDVFKSESELQQFLQQIADPNVDVSKLKFPFPSVLQKVQQREAMGGGAVSPPLTVGPQRIAPNFAEAYARQQPQHVSAGQDLAQLLQPDASGGIGIPKEQVVQGQAPTLIPQPPKTAAEIALKGQQTRTGKEQERLAALRGDKIEEEIPFVSGLAGSQIRQREASARALNAQAAATPKRVENDTKRTLDSIRKTDEQIRNNKANNQIAMRRVKVAEEASVALNELRRMQTIKTGQNAAMLEVQIRRLAESLPPDQAAAFKALASKITAFDPMSGQWVPNPEVDTALEQLSTLLDELSKTPGKGGGAGAPSDARLSTQNATQKKGTAGEVRSTSQGNFKASWQVNRGKGSTTEGPPPGVDRTVFEDKAIRKKVEDEMSDPIGYKDYLGGLNARDRKTVEAIRMSILNQRKAKKQPQKKGVPSMMSAPRR